MCGIFGIIATNQVNYRHLRTLAHHSRQRGRDASGLIAHVDGGYRVDKADYDIKRLLAQRGDFSTNFVMGHSRLITNGLADNQPIIRDGTVVLHNGIVVNDDEIWRDIPAQRNAQIDTEVIAALAGGHLDSGGNLRDLPRHILANCKGTVAAALIFPKQGKLCLFSNNGSLYIGRTNGGLYISSEKYPLDDIGCGSIEQIRSDGFFHDIPVCKSLNVNEHHERIRNLIPPFKNISAEEDKLVYRENALRRCTKCILPETMPFITFDEAGECNYCKNYKPRNTPKPRQEIFELIKPYRRREGAECIVPFSGGRDSCWGLHLIVKELGLKPITYTYDWGMVTDLGRRNISRMCGQLGVENIIFAADIAKKRDHIKMNLKAWLKSPNLGMVSILTAGDKHFFRHIETVKRQTGINLNLWGINPLEVTHFKAGFLGVPPDFEEEKVYANGWSKQLNYQLLRLSAMTKSPGYFNSSLWDTITGEYYRSVTKKTDYFHLFDYWRWDETVCNQTLAGYDWELAPDTTTTWRIGDGTAAFYNYIYFTMAGFTEHDTFRSNQIREGQISRQEALNLVTEENRPRYQNIRWYLDSINMDYEATVNLINEKALGVG